MSNRHLNEAVRKLAWQTTEEFVVLTRKEADALWEQISESKAANIFVDVILAIEKMADDEHYGSRGLKLAVHNALEKLNGKSTQNSNTNDTTNPRTDAVSANPG